MTQEFTQDADRDEVFGFWEEEFGVESEVFEDYDLYMKGRSKVWITSAETVEDFEYESVGLPFLRINQEHPKPTTDALQVFGEYASKNTVELDSEDARTFVKGETLETEFEVESLGYVIVTYDDEVLGCGLYFPGELRSQMPKGRRVSLEI